MWLRFTFLSLAYFVPSAFASYSNLHKAGALPSDLAGLSSLSACHVLLPSEGNGFSCNPAMLTFFSERQFSANAFIGEDYELANEYRADIEDEDALSIAERLLEGDRLLKLEAGSRLAFRTESFSVAYLPLSINYFSETTNQAFPVVQIDAAFESSLALQYAYAADFDSLLFSAGLTARAVDRSYVSDQVALLEVVADPDQLEIQRQRLVFLEPGFVLAYDNSWKPRFSVHATNIEVYNNGAASSSAFGGPTFDWGVGSLIPLGFGQLDVGVSYRDRAGFTSTSEQFRLATAYNLGLMTANAGFSEKDSAFGVSTTFLSARVGVSFAREEIELSGQVKETLEKISMEVGFVF